MSPDNILIVMTSPLTGTGAPSTSRYDISAKSPQTGAIGHSNSGGNFGIHLKRAGWDGLIVRGKAKGPVYLDIDEEQGGDQGCNGSVGQGHGGDQGAHGRQEGREDGDRACR
ncbi:MAG: hypothetical protein MZU91_00250 [Desulfosudis oleivorans]|nr:hypothetical protein [Desulfosudis oleivorans]